MGIRQNRGCVGLEDEKNGKRESGYRFLLGVMKMFYNYIMVMVTQLCKYTKNH